MFEDLLVKNLPGIGKIVIRIYHDTSLAQGVRVYGDALYIDCFGSFNGFLQFFQIFFFYILPPKS